jgi:signal transduction histidine kinase
MSFRFRIAAWVVISCTLLVGVMIYTAHTELEEELRVGRVDRHHQQIDGWKLHNSLEEEEIQDILGELMKTWLWTAAVMIPLSLGAGLLLARRSLRPVHDINLQLSAMRPDSMRGGIKSPEADPAIEGLADHLNGLLERAGIADQQMAEFSARVAHELRTPLMLLRMRVEHAPPGMPPAFQEDLQDELARLARFVERALLSAKAEQGGLHPTITLLSLSDLVSDVTSDYQLLATERSLHMKVLIAPDIQIHADADLLLQTLHGLLENAVRYAKSEILVSCRAGQEGAVLELHNDRDPATAATPGLGLGLRLVRGICRASGVDFEVHEDDHSFRAGIRFPAAEEFP